jgi:prephenate dehydrogenase
MPERPRICIIGLGRIGGSLGLALRHSGAELQVVGHDKEPDVAADAKKQGAVDRTSWNLIASVEGADVVVLALPLPAIRETLEAIAADLRPGAVVTDTASTKRIVMAWADELLPATVSFVGGNPLLKSVEGTSRYEAHLFEGCDYCLVPAASADPRAVELIANMVSLVGAKPYFLDAAEHDGLVTAVTHLPAVLATALLRATTANVAWREMARMAGATYRRATALPSDDPQAIQELFFHNRANLIRWVDCFTEALAEIRGVLATEDETALVDMLDTLLTTRERWARGLAEGGPTPTERGLDEVEGFSLRSWLGFRSPRRKS